MPQYHRFKKKYRPAPAPRNYNPRFHEYERLKLEWINAHPEADHKEYCLAIRKIAEDCGI